jgi:hypothetical protein
VSPVVGGVSLLLTGLALVLRRSSRDATAFSRNPFPADRRGWAIYFFRGKKGKLVD